MNFRLPRMPPSPVKGQAQGPEEGDDHEKDKKKGWAVKKCEGYQVVFKRPALLFRRINFPLKMVLAPAEEILDRRPSHMMR